MGFDADEATWEQSKLCKHPKPELGGPSFHSRDSERGAGSGKYVQSRARAPWQWRAGGAAHALYVT
ncbi:hypothetical protein RR48_12198 [Papilio machaon]|uniref:Uncharacterized protein n=1 Tax=Papilio machaon TaxID=76193 RepID=A0A194QTX2_PAPMA|nr:hypothetical protein RR48_12198 [Papilio machaon]